MGYFALRVDSHWDLVVAWLALFSGWAVREGGSDGSNEHWHVCFYSEKKISAVRTDFNRKLPQLKGNGAYSLTEVKDYEKYVRYMAKGESEGVCPEYAWRNGLEWTDEKLEELHEAYWTENRKLKKRKIGSIVDSVVDVCKRDDVRWDRRDRITEVYIRELVARGRPINLFAVKSGVNLAQVQLCPDDRALHELVERALV